MSTPSGPIVPGNTGMSQLLLPTVREPALFLALDVASLGRVLELAASFVGIPSKCAPQDSPMLAVVPAYRVIAGLLPVMKNYEAAWSRSRARLSSRPSTARTSNIGGDVVRPVRAARRGCAMAPSLRPARSA